MLAAIDWVNVWALPPVPPPPPPGILIEAVPLDTVAVTPVPVKSIYEAVPWVIPSSWIYKALNPPPPPLPAFIAYDAVTAYDADVAKAATEALKDCNE